MPPQVAETMTTTRSDINLQIQKTKKSKQSEFVVTHTCNPLEKEKEIKKDRNCKYTSNLVAEQDTLTWDWI